MDVYQQSIVKDMRTLSVPELKGLSRDSEGRIEH